MALRNELKTDDNWRNWRLQTRSSFLISRDSVQKSRYFVSRLQLSKPLKHVVFDVDNLLEYNVFRTKNTDSLRMNSFAFNELNVSMQSAEKAVHRFGVGYKNRVEFAPEDLLMRTHLLVHEVKAQYKFAQIKNQSFSLNATYRNQSLFDSAGARSPEHYFVGNVQYTGRFLRNALIINTYYESGSGMELKKTFTFIRVAKGQGTHVWNDYNGNGIEELDEFEVTPYPDEAEYVKVWIAGNEYVNAWQSQWTQSFQLRPAAERQNGLPQVPCPVFRCADSQRLLETQDPNVPAVCAVGGGYQLGGEPDESRQYVLVQHQQLAFCFRFCGSKEHQHAVPVLWT